MLSTNGATVTGMANEGEKLRAALAAVGKTPADLARVVNVTPTAVARYLKAEVIGKNAWLTVRPGLAKLGIDPQKIKADDSVVTLETDLRPLVSDFNRDQLERLRTILQEDMGPREKLLYYIDGMLHPRK